MDCVLYTCIVLWLRLRRFITFIYSYTDVSWPAGPQIIICSIYTLFCVACVSVICVSISKYLLTYLFNMSECKAMRQDYYFIFQ